MMQEKKKSLWMNQTQQAAMISTSSVYGVEPFKYAKQALLRLSVLQRLLIFSLTEKRDMDLQEENEGLL